MIVKKEVEQLNFMNDSLSPSEVIDLIIKSIDMKINLCKIEYMSIWEANHCVDTSEIDNKIMDLTNRKNSLIKRIEKIRADKATISLDSILELKVIK